jgi:hypothetical protein
MWDVADWLARETRTIRNRQRYHAALLDLTSADAQKFFASAAFLVQTTQVETYPTVPGAFYACLICNVNGAEVEGAEASYVPVSDTIIYVWNTGTQIPPLGTMAIAQEVGGRFVFRYSG